MNPIMKRLPAALLAACNAALTGPVVSISTVNPKTDAELKATIVMPSTDPNGDPVAVSDAWLKNNERQGEVSQNLPRRGPSSMVAMTRRVPPQTQARTSVRNTRRGR
jgi:hypothetical protein